MIKLGFMIDIADLRFIQAIAAAPSLAAAARALNVTPPAVSQRLAQLESRLRLKLVERGAGGLCLTGEGELMAARAEVLLTDLADLSDALAERRGAVTGPLRVVAPFGFGRLHIAPLIASFALRHLEVVPSLKLTEDPRGAMRTDAWDVLIHVGRLPDLNIVQRKLAPNRRVLCTAPAYIERNDLPATPRDLLNHRCGVVREDQADVTLWSLNGPGAQHETVRIEAAFESNDGEVIRSWVIAGLGITERSEWSVADDLRTNRLVRVLGDWSLPDADIVALINPRSIRAARIDCFLSHLSEHFAQPQWCAG